MAKWRQFVCEYIGCTTKNKTCSISCYIDECHSRSPLMSVIQVCTMMTSSDRNIFRVTGPLCGEFTGHRWLPRTKASDAELWCCLWSGPWTNGWVNNRDAGDLRRHCTHNDVIVMCYNHCRYHCCICLASVCASTILYHYDNHIGCLCVMCATLSILPVG